MKKKLQVFVSSTWTDMILERQAAVEAILEAGHIPAGMELFSADNKKQFEVIKKWIRDSDVFILILGGRYGSRENGIGKSYIQREYEYAKRIGKKPIAIILSDKGIANKIAKGDYEISDAEYLQNDYKIFKSSIKNNKMCSFFDDLSSLKNCVMNALRNCEENSNLLGWVRASDAIGDFTYPYVLENQEFCMEYISTTVIKYTKKLYIRMLADGIQYYTDRYSWNAGGTITKSLKNKNQLIVDEFSDGAFQAYTVRLEEASQKGKIYIIDAEFFIYGCNYVEHQYLGLTNSFPVRNLTLCVRVANNLKLLECKYNMYGHSVDRVPKISKVIKPKSGIIEHTFKNLVIGERYNLEWRVVKK